MSNQVDSLSFLFPYISFNECRQNYQSAIANLKPVLDQLVASGAQDKSGLLSLASSFSSDPNSLQNSLDQLHNDEQHAMDALNKFLNANQ